MKKVKIPNPKPQQLINWDSPQWVISDNCVVLTTGEHEGENFTGTCLPCGWYPKGLTSNSWSKGVFERLTFDIHFTISNE